MQGLRSRVVAAIVAGVLLFPTTISAQSQPASPSFRSPTDDELRTTKNGGANWVTYGGALNGQRFSTLDQVNNAQQQAGQLAQQFDLNAPDVNLHDVMVSLQKASHSFQTMVQVRNRLVSAYQEIMNMQV